MEHFQPLLLTLKLDLVLSSSLYVYKYDMQSSYLYASEVRMSSLCMGMQLNDVLIVILL